nr:hypothetical protein GCM10020093_010810 [Planobispora longispora]
MSDVETVNQQPPVGASALEAGTVQGYAQFVAWPGLLVFQDKARLLYDGAALDVPTFHGTVVRAAYAEEHPEVVDAFLKAQIDATRYLHEHPLEAAESVAEETGLPAEVVYLYNGPGGISTFDVTLKPQLKAAHEHDVPYLKRIGDGFSGVDLTRFVNDSHLREAYGPAYDADTASTANPAAITGDDPVCGIPVKDPATASELWLAGERPPAPRRPPPACCAGSRRRRRTGRRTSAPPTCPTPRPAPAGSPTGPSGSRTRTRRRTPASCPSPPRTGPGPTSTPTAEPRPSPTTTP